MKRFSTTRPTALSASLNSTDVTVYLVDGSTFPDPAVPGNGPYTVLIGYGSDREEICTVTAKPGVNILTVTRGEDGSAAVSKNIGDTVVHGVSKRDWDSMLPLEGGTLTGPLVLAADPAVALGAATKQYADTKAPATRTVTAGNGLTGGGDLSANRTLDVGAGTGISVAADTVGIDTANPIFTGRNRVINGCFSVNQRGFTSTTASGAFGLDRWLVGHSGGTVTYSTQSPALGTLPESARSNARLVTSGQAAAGDYAQLVHRIESVRTLSGKTATISFWAKAGSGTPKVAVQLIQSFGTGGSPSSTVSVPAGQVTLSTSWVRYSVTVAIPSISGKTLGSDENDHLGLALWTSAGSTHNTATGSLGLQAATIDFWGVQVEEGSVATPFEQKSYADELRACQRYFWRTGMAGVGTGQAMAYGFASSTVQGYFGIQHPVPMRAVPVISYSGTFNVSDRITNWAVTTIPALTVTCTETFADVVATVAGGLTAHWPLTLYGSVAGASLMFSAEL